MSILRRLVPDALRVGLFLSVAIFPAMGQEAGAAADPLSPEERAFVVAHGPIRYAPDPQFPPFEFLDSSRVARGITPDLLIIMGGKLGVEFRTVAYPTWSDVLEAVKRGKVDLLGTLTRTPEREGFLLFSRPYLSLPYVLFVRRNGSDPKTVEDMVSRRLGVVRNYGINAWLSAEHPKIRPVAVEDTATGLAMVATGQLDALLETLPVGAQIAREKSLTNIRIVPLRVYTLPQHFGVRKGEPLLLSIVQKGLDSLTGTERSEVFVRWTGQDFSRPPPAISPLLRDALLILVAAAVLSWVWIVALRRNVRRATQSLRASEEKFRTVADFTGDWEYWMGPDRSIRYTSPSCDQITGYPAEAFAGDPGLMFRIVDPADRPRFDEHISDYLDGSKRGGAIGGIEFRIVRSDGEVRWVGHVCSPVFGADGTFQGRRGSNRDVTDRKRGEERLKSLKDCFLGFGADPVENINRLTAAVGEFLGATCALYNRLEGDSLHSLGRWNTPPDFNPVDRAEGHICHDVIRRALGDVLVLRNLQESPYARTDPNVVAYGLQSYVGQAVEFGGKCVGSLCAVFQRDHTLCEGDKELMRAIAKAIGVEEERRRATEALRESEAKYKELVDELPQPVFEVDTRGKLTFGNRCALDIFGFTLDDLRNGLEVLPFFVPEDRDRAGENIRRALNGEKMGGEEYALLRKDGSKAPAIIYSSPIVRNDETVGIRGVIVDITERKRAEEERLGLELQVQQAQKMDSLGVLAGGIAHDFNNILMAVLGHAELALAEISPMSAARRNLEEITIAARRAADLSRQMLAYAGKASFALERVALRDLSVGRRSTLCWWT